MIVDDRHNYDFLLVIIAFILISSPFLIWGARREGRRMAQRRRDDD